MHNQNRTRNNGLKLVNFRFVREMGRNWFSNTKPIGTDSVIIYISAEIMGSFTRRFDKFMEEDDRWN